MADGITADQLRQMLMEVVGQPTPVSGGMPGELRSLIDSIKSFSSDIRKDIEDQTKWMKEVVKTIKDRGSKRYKKDSKETVKNSVENPKQFEKFLNTMVDVGAIERKKAEDVLKKLGKNNERSQKTFDSIFKEWEEKKQKKPELKKMDAYEAGLNIEMPKEFPILKHFSVDLSNIYKDIFKNSIEINKGMREIAYQIDGATGDAKRLHAEYMKIDKVVSRTGVSAEKFQLEHMKNIKKGFKDLKKSYAVTESQLHTEKQLGLEAGSLAETFTGLSLSGKMTNSEIADMGRGIRDVARSTGVTGEHLANAVKSSENFVKNLRNAGHLTALSARNMIELVTNAQKLGMEDTMMPLMDAMTDSYKFLYESSNQTQNFLRMAATSVGRYDELLNGTIGKSKAGMADMAKGIGNVLGTMGARTREQFDKLSDDQKRDMNIRMKLTTGMTMEQGFRAQEVYEETSKTTGQKLKELQEKSKNIHLMSSGEVKELEEKTRSLKTTASMDILSQLNNATKGSKDLAESYSKFMSKEKDFASDREALGIKGKTGEEITEAAMKEALKGLNQGLAKAKKEQPLNVNLPSKLKITEEDISKAIKSGDQSQIQAVMERLQAGEKELSTAMQQNLTPQGKLEAAILQLNETMKSYIDPLGNMLNSLTGFKSDFLSFTSMLPQLVNAIVLAKSTSSAWSFGRGVYNKFRGRKEKDEVMAPPVQNKGWLKTKIEGFTGLFKRKKDAKDIPIPDVSGAKGKSKKKGILALGGAALDMVESLATDADASTGSLDCQCICDCLKNSTLETGMGIADSVASVIDGGLTDVLGKEKKLAKAADTGKDLTKAAGKGKGFFGKAASKIGGFFSGAGGLVGGLFGKQTGDIASKASGAISSGGIMSGLFGKSGGGIAKMAGKSFLKKIPLLGAVAGAGFAVSEAMKGNFSGAITELASGIAGAVPVIGTALSVGIDLFSNKISDGISWVGGKFTEVGSWLGEKTMEGMAWLGSKTSEAASWIGTKFTDAGTWIGEKTFEATNWLGKKITEGGQYLWGGIQSLGNSIAGGGEYLWGGIQSLGNSIADGAKYLWDGIKNAVYNLYDGLKNFGSTIYESIFGKDENTIKNPEKEMKNIVSIKGADEYYKSEFGMSELEANNIKTSFLSASEGDEFKNDGFQEKSRLSIKSPYSEKLNDYQSAIMEIKKQSVTAEPNKSEIVSSELDVISEESTSQTVLLQEISKTMASILKEMKGNQSGGSSSDVGDTSMNRVLKRPPNFHRNTIGLVSQDPSKGYTNYGPPKK